jgi:type VI secretion system protein ImpG
MINRYFQEELANLRELGAEYAHDHPAVAPMLSGVTSDPDVERLLEGVAFLTGLLRAKLEDDFPEITHELIQLIWPHLMRPIPCSAIVAFTPKPVIKQTLVIPAGIQIASVPVEETVCLFQTAAAVEVHPLMVTDAAYRHPSGQPPAVSLSLESVGLPLAEWHPTNLRLHLAAAPPAGADMVLLLQRHLRHIVLKAADDSPAVVLPPECLRPVGFAPDDRLLPFPSQSFPGFRILQEYFALPEKFLFLDLVGWERWTQRGNGNRFEIAFVLDSAPPAPLRLRAQDFVLGAVPAVNVFSHDADPIRLEHRRTDYPVRPAAADPGKYQVYAVERVAGYVHGTAQERLYSPFEYFRPHTPATPAYHVKMKNSPVRPGLDVLLSVPYLAEAGAPVQETLSIILLCTNGSLPEALKAGDICVPTSSTPEYVDFHNLRPPTPAITPPVGGNVLWRLVSHLALNFLSIENPDHLKALLSLYAFDQRRDRSAHLANLRRIAGLAGLEVRGADKLVAGIMMRGRRIRLDARVDHFAGPGDLYLFGCILDYFVSAYAALNTFTEFSIREVVNGEEHRWPARIGDRHLL